MLTKQDKEGEAIEKEFVGTVEEYVVQ